jgi:hypothetical protein
MNVTPVTNYYGLPESLKDVIHRIWDRDDVFGFELELLASYVSQ